MSKSIARQRREAYSKFSDADFREAVFELAEELQAAGTILPPNMLRYVNHVNSVKASIPKPKP